ncbi:MAG: serine--tRNA ligase [Spirochaetes bacterium GWD1_27_9]|nr:MAG: serine--tRNA ligase [Spirochaetes bacterium GWB1_27_13]OHD20905.1 MAG: serine--tRNA ligase [Spirochaetes bacterium GWC1_27_15]OHD44709.1 MAG: serine--tRNA ligase [Spirochaetes bacterium GWD1_27_9]
MVDIKFVKENLEIVKENIKKRNVKADAEKVIELYNKKNSLQLQLDGIRNKKNENAQKMKGKLPEDERNKLIEEGKDIKNQIASLEEEQKKLEEEYLSEYIKLPNLTHPTTPIGDTDKDSTELKKVGNPRQFNFKPKDHTVLANDLDIVDFEAGASVAGQKFYYLKNEGCLLELALVQFAMRLLVEKGFTPYMTPDMAKSSILEGIGFAPRGNETNIYSIENSDLCLIATAEITIGGMFLNKVLEEKNLPLKMAGFSHCFRTEAGAAGQATRGLYRVHQFSKVEMFVICKPEDSDKILEDLRSIEEEIYTKLGIPYRVLDIASGDLGNPAYKKYDLEAWMPGRGEYGEITSTSNCTDFQSRRLNIKFKDSEGKNKFVHMLNGTAIAVPRVIISILENFQREDGSVEIPEVLVPYIGSKEITRKGK